MSTVMVYDVETGTMREVPSKEAAAGVLRYARTLGAGSAACGEFQLKALRLTAEQVED
jgi:hypothetical protein